MEARHFLTLHPPACLGQLECKINMSGCFQNICLDLLRICASLQTINCVLKKQKSLFERPESRVLAGEVKNIIRRHLRSLNVGYHVQVWHI